MVEDITIVEGDSSTMICVTMSTTPTAATLEKEVVVTLSTEDSTGKQEYCFQPSSVSVWDLIAKC